MTAAQRDAEEEKERAARGRWRRFSRRRQQDADEQPPEAARTTPTSQLDQILAHRDQVLLADRDDPAWDDRRGYEAGNYALYDRDLGAPRRQDDPRDWDRDLGDDPYQRPEPTVELPRFHEPRRGAEPGHGEGRPSEAPLPPPRRPQDTPPPGTDPADD